MPNIKSSKSLIRDKTVSGKKTIGKSSGTGIKTAIRKPVTLKSRDPLTKKILIEAASEGFSKAAAKTMKVMGHNVIVKNGWVVKKFADGRIEKISKLKSTNKPVILD